MHIDQHYIEALRRNDPQGIQAIYRQFAAQAQRWINQHNGSTADAQDIFQEAILTVYEKALQPDFVLTCPLGALLHVIYSRRWMDRLRHKNREQGVRNAEEQRYTLEVTEDTLVAAEDALANQTRQQRFAQTFTQLSDLCRQLMTLLTNGIPPQQAAVELQLNSVNTLYRRKNACMERWRTLIQSPE